MDWKQTAQHQETVLQRRIIWLAMGNREQRREVKKTRASENVSGASSPFTFIQELGQERKGERKSWRSWHVLGGRPT